MTSSVLVDHFFRHEYGHLVAMLSRRVGVENIEEIEDAVQAALMSALEYWTISRVPDNPSAWLYRAAHNNLLGALRKSNRQRRILRDRVADHLVCECIPDTLNPDEVQDDLLSMLFVCCDEKIPIESQLVFALKTLCGFDVREIAIRLFTSEAAVYKRLSRARRRLRELQPNEFELNAEQIVQRAPAVRKVLYLLFTEGYLSSNTEFALRRELCDEAIRLLESLANKPFGQSPETCALLALMHLQTARMSARDDGSGGLLLLEEQNRELWNRERIAVGLKWLANSAEGDAFSRYHAEAGIAAEHCLSPSFAETRWDRIAECYELVEQSNASPIHRLNRAIAVAEWKSPSDALAMLDGFEPPTWLTGSYLWAAVLSDLNRRCGNTGDAVRHRERAVASAPTPQIEQLLKRRLMRT